MITEVLDKHSGAILFKKDEDGLTLEKLKSEFEKMRKTISKLEKRVAELEKK